ncbi:MAG TPA: alkaline phosphatase D family protein [Vicinamibacterales bacterium]|nr:alkaline phosphatase D family protein [Vicinamibacterales bacterium]
MSTKDVDRRTFLRATGALGMSRMLSRAAPAESSVQAQTSGAPAIIAASTSRPSAPFGVAAGDVSGGRAIIWSRADRSARMFVEYATTERFADVRRVRGPAALEPSDFTSRVVVSDLPAGQRIFYRVLFQDLSDLRAWSEPVTGSFNTPASAPRDVTVAWSADTVGQGWGINPEWGGLRMYDTMRRAQPDVFINVGDTIYADQPVLPEVKLDDGSTWKNLVTPAKSKVAESIDEYRGCYQYNLGDAHMRRFIAEVPQIVMWDDHEVRDNWYWERRQDGDPRYQIKSVALLAARGRQAFFEYNPLPLVGDDPERVYRSIPLGPLVEVFALDMRTYKGANGANRQGTMDDSSAILGAAQLRWLKAALAASRATWKIIAADLPLGLVVPDGAEAFEAVANRDNGAPLGRELEIAGLLRFIRDQRVRNTVWITADVHYCSAHHYDPSRARFTEFDPFWEFVAGPLHAGTFGPNALDGTFGPEVRFSGVPPGTKGNRPPSDGLQFFGTMRVDARTRAMTVQLRDLAGKTLYSVDLAPTQG